MLDLRVQIFYEYRAITGGHNHKSRNRLATFQNGIAIPVPTFLDGSDSVFGLEIGSVYIAR